MQLLPLATYLAAIALILRRRGHGIRQTFLLTCLIFGVTVVVLTESLSLVHGIVFSGVLIAWIIAAILACGFAVFDRRLRKDSSIRGERAGWSQAATATFKLPLIAVATIVLITGAIGVCSAPANWDSMTYHLARVMHWMQSGSVEHYRSNFHPQLYHGPLAEFIILHLQVLTGGDRFAFFVQWFAMIGCVAAASLIAGLLGAGPAGQMLSAVLVATLPTGILQAESTQNNYVVALWLMGFAYSILLYEKSGSNRWVLMSLQSGCFLGLACLTKGTAYMFALPLVLWAAVVMMKRVGFRAIHSASIVLLCVLALNGPYFARNLKLFHAPLVPAEEVQNYRVDTMGPRLLYMNVVRHVAGQLWLPTNWIVSQVDSAVAAMSRTASINASDPRITAPGHQFALKRSIIHEDVSGSPLQFFLIAVASLVGLFTVMARRHIRSGFEADTRTSLTLLGLICAAFVIFCGTVKWMAYNTRLELPLFVLAAAPTASILTSRLTPRQTQVLMLALFLSSIPFVVANPSHPLFGRHSIFEKSREEQYFVNNPKLLLPYQHVIDELVSHKISTFGFCADEGWEYPLWVLYRNRTGKWPIIIDVPGNPLPAGEDPTEMPRLGDIVVIGENRLSFVEAMAGTHARNKSFGPAVVVSDSPWPGGWTVARAR